MRKGLFLVVIAVLFCNAFCITGHCANMTTYSDAYVSFEYDADFLASIEFWDSNMGLEKASYTIDTAMQSDEKFAAPFARISINNTEYGLKLSGFENGIREHFNSDSENESYAMQNINENELFATAKSKKGTSHYCKLLYADDDTYITMLYYDVEGYDKELEFVKHVYDTISVNESYGSGSYTKPENEFVHTRIFSNVLISEQMLNYANEAIRIIESYLAFEIDEDTAQGEIKDLYHRMLSYKTKSGYLHDEDVCSALYLAEYKFDGNSDVELLEMIDELEMLCGLGNK